MPFALRLYAAATRLLTPVAPLILRRRLRRGKEHPQRWRERLGEHAAARPAGPLLWIHGASVGEANSALPLIEALHDRLPALRILMTTGTVTSAELMGRRLPAYAQHSFVPIDAPAAAARFLDHWRPDAAVWLESELWPNLIQATAARGVPMALVNGRMSARSAARWRRWPRTIAALLAPFRLVLTQSEDDAARYQSLGAPAQCLGDLKWAAAPLPVDDAALTAMRARLGDRPVWAAVSTHRGEEPILAQAHQILAARRPGLLTIVIPRHPPRGPEAEADLRAAAPKSVVTRRAAGDAPPDATGIYVADTLGELGLWLRLARVAFVGGSLIRHGGQNPLEPARLGLRVIHGPHMENFRPTVAALTATGWAQAVTDAATLADALDAAFDAPPPAAPAPGADTASRIAEAVAQSLSPPSF